MPRPKGLPKTGGRPPGGRNKKTVQMETAAAQIELAARLLAEPFGGDALTLLQLTYRDSTRPIELRLEAAKAAIRYEKPALASVDLTSLNEHTVSMISDKPLTPDEWLAQHGRPTEH